MYYTVSDSNGLGEQNQSCLSHDFYSSLYLFHVTDSVLTRFPEESNLEYLLLSSVLPRGKLISCPRSCGKLKNRRLGTAGLNLLAA
jgi:hypothetical protein